MKDQFPNASESFKAKNPHLFPSVARLRDPEPEHGEIPSLDSGPRKQAKGATCVAGLVVSIISYRTKYLDSDNLVGGIKALRDCIARTLGFDDADPRIKWEYGQVITQGQRGTQVTITIQQ